MTQNRVFPRSTPTLLLMAAALAGCPSSSSDHGPSTPDQADAGATQVVGTFTISLVAPSANDSSGHTSLVGKVYDGPTPAQVVWETASESGDCQLSKPRVPFCSTPCGGSAACVEDDQCQDYPTAHSVGTVQVSGVKTTSGANDFSLDPVANTYQPSGAVALRFPAFAEGDAIRLAAKGGDFSAFTLSAKGVAPLELAQRDLTLARNTALQLSWTAAGASAASRIHVKLDISHHGGSKGMIECDADDDGSLEIASELITSLLDLGAAGYPTIIVTRHSGGSAQIAPGTVNLLISSSVEQAVSVPGLASCNDDTDCPTGKTCQSDLSCK
jgi:hypothetical protein